VAESEWRAEWDRIASLAGEWHGKAEPAGHGYLFNTALILRADAALREAEGERDRLRAALVRANELVTNAQDRWQAASVECEWLRAALAVYADHEAWYPGRDTEMIADVPGWECAEAVLSQVGLGKGEA
jgi:hypothetical protein